MQNSQNNITKKQLIATALSDIVHLAKRAKPITSLGLMAHGSELGIEEFIRGAKDALRQDTSLQIVVFGPTPPKEFVENKEENLLWVETEASEQAVSEALNTALAQGQIQGAVALHYPFPLGVTTIGKIHTPAKGKPLYIASCTGTSSTERAKALLLNAIYGIAVAKADGISHPSVGFLHLDTAPTVERALRKLQENGYEFSFGNSVRQDKGTLLRGNDVLTGAVDVCVTDSLTGNVLIKVFGAYTSGGTYETMGWGYGPSVGSQWNSVISIISRASGAPVISNALLYTATVTRAQLPTLVAEEMAKAHKAGLETILASLSSKTINAPEDKSITAPAAEPTDTEIHGIDVLDIDAAAQSLWKKGIYAESAMGCTGPVLKIAQKNYAQAKNILAQANFL